MEKVAEPYNLTVEWFKELTNGVKSRKMVLYMPLILDDIKKKYSNNPKDVFKSSRSSVYHHIDAEKFLKSRTFADAKTISEVDIGNKKIYEVILNNGTKYIGEINENYNPNNNGIYFFKNGIRCEGIWEDGYLKYGKKFDEIGNRYEGYFKNNEGIEGVTYLCNNDGSICDKYNDASTQGWFMFVIDMFGRRKRYCGIDDLYKIRKDLICKYCKNYCNDFVKENLNRHFDKYIFSDDNLKSKADKLAIKARELLELLSIYYCCGKYFLSERSFVQDLRNIVYDGFSEDKFKIDILKDMSLTYGSFSKEKYFFNIHNLIVCDDYFNDDNNFNDVMERIYILVQKKILPKFLDTFDEYKKIVNIDKRCKKQYDKKNVKRKKRKKIQQNVFDKQDKKSFDVTNDNLKSKIKNSIFLLKNSNLNSKVFNEKNNSSIFRRQGYNVVDNELDRKIIEGLEELSNMINDQKIYRKEVVNKNEVIDKNNDWTGLHKLNCELNELDRNIMKNIESYFEKSNNSIIKKRSNAINNAIIELNKKHNKDYDKLLLGLFGYNK